jgi:AcrR family transcriptional regulator
MAPRISPTRPAHGKQARAERTRAMAIDETVRCVLEEGVSAASAKHIAERAGVTWGVIQYHFGDRNGLLMAVVDQGHQELTAALAEVPTATATMTTRDRVELAVTAAWEAMSSPTSRAAIEILIATRADRDAAFADHLNQLGTAFAELCALLDDRLSGSQRAELGDLLLNNMRGLVTTQLIMSRDIETASSRRILIEVISSYIDQRM